MVDQQGLRKTNYKPLSKVAKDQNEKRCSPRLPFYRGNFNNRIVLKLDQHMEKKVIKLILILTPLPIQPGLVNNYFIQVVGFPNLRKI